MRSVWVSSTSGRVPSGPDPPQCHTMTISFEATARSLPRCSQASRSTLAGYPLISRSSPVESSHTLEVESWLPEASQRPSGEIATTRIDPFHGSSATGLSPRDAGWYQRMPP